jgi:exportin-T
MKDLLQLNTPSQAGASVMKFALSDGDQLYIYEACSTLIMASRLDNEVCFPYLQCAATCLNVLFPQSKAALFQELVNPLMSRIRPLLDEMLAEGNPERKEALADTVCHAMALTSRSSKAFSSQQSMKIVGCHKMYLHALETFFMLCLQVK